MIQRISLTNFKAYEDEEFNIAPLTLIAGINGMGKLMVDAIAGDGVDYNYVLALGILFSSMYIFVMLILDILYGILDPRIRISKEN